MIAMIFPIVICCIYCTRFRNVLLRLDALLRELADPTEWASIASVCNLFISSTQGVTKKRFCALTPRIRRLFCELDANASLIALLNWRWRKLWRTFKACTKSRAGEAMSAGCCYLSHDVKPFHGSKTYSLTLGSDS